MVVYHFYILEVAEGFDRRVEGLVVFAPHIYVNVSFLGSSENSQNPGTILARALDRIEIFRWKAF